MTSEKRSTGRLFTGFLVLACIVLAVEVVVLAKENRRLKDVLAGETDVEHSLIGRQRLQFGDLFQPFTLRNSEGALETVEFEDRKTLLLVFAEQCPACPEVMPTWARIVPILAGSVRVLGIRLDPASHTGELQPPAGGIPVYAVTDATQVPMAKLTTVPLTALLDEGGMVMWARYGTLSPAQTDELLGLLDQDG